MPNLKFSNISRDLIYPNWFEGNWLVTSQDLKDDLYIDSRITGRTQIRDDDMFFADELVLQTSHKPGASRVNQVETISKFQKCNLNFFNSDDTLKPDICGFQYIATYGSKVGNPSVYALSLIHI